MQQIGNDSASFFYLLEISRVKRIFFLHRFDHVSTNCPSVEMIASNLTRRDETYRNERNSSTSRCSLSLSLYKNEDDGDNQCVRNNVYSSNRLKRHHLPFALAFVIFDQFEFVPIGHPFLMGNRERIFRYVRIAVERTGHPQIMLDHFFIHILSIAIFLQVSVERNAFHAELLRRQISRFEVELVSRFFHS